MQGGRPLNGELAVHRCSLDSTRANLSHAILADTRHTKQIKKQFPESVEALFGRFECRLEALGTQRHIYLFSPVLAQKKACSTRIRPFEQGRGVSCARTCWVLTRRYSKQAIGTCRDQTITTKPKFSSASEEKVRTKQTRSVLRMATGRRSPQRTRADQLCRSETARFDLSPTKGSHSFACLTCRR